MDWTHQEVVNLFLATCRNQLEAVVALCGNTPPGLIAQLREEVATGFSHLNERIEVLMALAEEFNAKLDSINTATNELAAVVAQLRTDLANPSMTPEQKTALLGRMDTLQAALIGIAANPDVPVPPALMSAAKKK